ncbi:MAG TPA: DEAD/DEAH box helicase family protein [Chitinophagaceae bacterium]|nr:DEAD/DEAH box helicase family protein [Chitinophagaceae bacterium]
MAINIELFKSLFKGRTDAFAVRWEKDGKAGYTPAYDLDWDEYRRHKENGGNLKNFANKKYAPLTDARLLNHLSGKEIIGIYPLLPDNTSWFIAADFDESVTKNWLTECRLFIGECRKYNLPVYLERSRSGNGGHVWLFFRQPYPAEKSRSIFKQILTACGVVQNKTASFDRLFPNQDYHSGKELGNLIALPLQPEALRKQNACFIDPGTAAPYSNQWEFLESVQKIDMAALDIIFKGLSAATKQSKPGRPVTHHYKKLDIILDNQLWISRQHLPNLLLRYLRDSLNFLNNAWFAKKNAGISTYNTSKYHTAFNGDEDSFIIPRGFTGNIIRYCREQNIEYNFEDRRTKHENVDFLLTASLHPYQEDVVEAVRKKDFGVIVSPPGSGKTIMGLAVIADKKQPALIMVHRKQLFDQWVERIQSFLGIPSFRVGKIEGGRCDIGHEITVAMIQSLQSEKIAPEVFNSFGTIIVDECHHIPAKTFSEVITRFHCFHLYGFTATPIRKNNDEKLIFIHIGDIIHEAIVPINLQGNKPLALIIQDTGFSLPFNPRTDNVETLMHVLVHDTARNSLITADVLKETKAGRKVLVLTERKAHIDILYQYLKASCEVIRLTGDDADEKRRANLTQVENGEFQVALATGQLVGEGMDINSINCLVLAYPFSFEGKLIQYIGRVQRSHTTPIHYDYRDESVPYLLNLFKERNKYYRKLLRENKLSKFDELILSFKEKHFCINETDQWLHIDCLDIPFTVERFIEGAVWKIRVLNYDEAEGSLFTEIVDYNYQLAQNDIAAQRAFYFYGIEKITFRAIDTTGLMQSVVLSNQPQVHEPIKSVSPSLQEQVLVKAMKVPLWKIQFLAGAVSFPVYVEELERELVFEIPNADIRPEFEAIREYFSKALKKKLIIAELAIRYNDTNILSATAKSKDIEDINSQMIDTMRFQFVKKEVLQGPPKTGKQLYTLDELPASNSLKKLYSTDQQLIDDLLAIKKSKHYHQLKYLASRHEATILKVRFTLQPFSFLFLVAGEKRYYIVWETLDTEEATYIWHTDKTREALKKILTQIDNNLAEIESVGRQVYITKEQEGFFRIMHDYVDAKKGFTTWKGMLDQWII